jgi:Fe-Mn family superoxide dismutase
MTCTTAVNVKNLNAALEKHPELFNKPADQLVRDLSSIPRDIPTAARSNGGGHVNHTMFWQIMKSKGGGEPTGKIADAIRNTIGGFDTFKQQFNDAGAKQFGSGWVWLAEGNGKIQILTRPTRTIPSARDCSQLWAMTSGSTHIIWTTTTAGPSTWRRVGTS